MPDQPKREGTGIIDERNKIINSLVTTGDFPSPTPTPTTPPPPLTLGELFRRLLEGK